MLLRYVVSRYEQAQASSDELTHRALELIVAACVAELRDTPDEAPSATSPEPLPDWSEDDIPKVDYDELAFGPGEPADDDDDDEPAPARPTEPEQATERAWWTSPSEPDPPVPPPEPMRGSWEPPRRP